MKRTRFRNMLRRAVAAPVALLAVLAITFLILIRWLNLEVALVEHTDRVISTAQETQRLLIDMETGVRGYLLTGERVFLEPYLRAQPAALASFTELRRLIADNPAQAALAADIEREFGDWQLLAAKMVSSRSDENLNVEAQIAGKAEMDSIRNGFTRFVSIEERLRTERSNSARGITNIVLGIAIVAALFLGLLVGLFSRRSLQNVASEFETALAESDAARVRAETLAVDNERLFLEAQSASRAKDDFLATLSHELRTPLTAILGWSRLLQIQDSPEMLTTALSAIERSAKSQAALIEDILDVSRIITGKMRLDLREVDVRAAIDGAIAAVQPAAQAKDITIDVDAPDALRFSADPNRLQQVIWNLLANSVKFSPAGAKIFVSAKRSGSEIVLSVKDQGRGIETAFLPFVFDRFRQADSTSTREFGGLGIGLSVVKLLVELHGGNVTAESDGAKKGATFTVRLPMHPIQQAAAATIEEQPVAGDGHPLLGRDVLVVDDDNDARAVLSAMLRTFGARVETASSVKDAMQFLSRKKFALVLSDIAMPGESGFTLLERLRSSRGPNADTPVVAVTALTAAAAKEGKSQFSATLRKPVDPTVLAATVASMMR